MISIIRATEKESSAIVNIGRSAVAEAHRGSCSDADLDDYLERNYNNNAIKEELRDSNNIYHILRYNNIPVGFSKIILNAGHPNIVAENVTKLDRIYVLKEYYGLKLGAELLNFNTRLAENNHQSGIWLYTWVENKRAIQFYLKAGFTIIGSHHFYVTNTHYNLNHHMFLKI